MARPWLALACAGLLAVGIGLSTAMFSVVDALVLRPVPFRAAERLVEMGLPPSGAGLIDEWHASGLFEAVEAGSDSPFSLESGTWPGAWITPGVLELVGVQPLRGRGFSGAAGAAEVMLSESLWRSVFGSDPGLLGQAIQVDDRPAVVVGIMPAAFRFPRPTTVMWMPLDISDPGRGLLTIFARTKPGVPLTEADSRMGHLALQLPELSRRRTGIPLNVLGEPELNDVTRWALVLLPGGAALVFLVLCANVSSLLLAQLSARRRELGMCTALGASRGRLVREVLAEHLFIGLLGVVAGIGLAWGLTATVPAMFVGRTLNAIDIDGRALLMASGLGLAAVVLAGLVPAWLGTRSDPMASLRGRSRQAGDETRAARLATRGLLIAQTALACSLLVGSLLLVRSFVNLVQADPGLNMDQVVRARITGIEQAFVSADVAASRRAVELAGSAIVERFSAWPQVAAAALSREIPPATPVELVHPGPPGTLSDDPSAAVRSDFYRVGASFFDVYRIAIVRGRTFQSGDTDRDVIVGERLAGLLWPGQDPIGKLFSVGGLKDARRVIGVAREIRLPSLETDVDRPEFYGPLGIARTLFLNVRCTASCPNEAEILGQIQAVHPALTVRMALPASGAYDDQLRLPGAAAQIAGLFAVIALLTTAGGLFSVLTYAVARRRREFGIRTALGAHPSQLRKLVLRDGLSVVAIGGALGAAGGWFVGRALASLHYGVSAADPLTWASVTAAMLVASLAALWRPARQAMRVDPVTLLKEE
jgi:predicted permease